MILIEHMFCVNGLTLKLRFGHLLRPGNSRCLTFAQPISEVYVMKKLIGIEDFIHSCSLFLRLI